MKENENQYVEALNRKAEKKQHTDNTSHKWKSKNIWNKHDSATQSEE